MECKNVLIAQNRAEFRAWLSVHHATEHECWVAVKRGLPKDDTTFWYLDAVEEALCFGWIDSTLKKIGGVATLALQVRQLRVQLFLGLFNRNN